MTPDISQSVEIENFSDFRLFSHPVSQHGMAYMYGVNIATVRKGSEIHFILQKGEGSDDEPLLKGHEGAGCLQVIRSFSEMLDGLPIEDIHFYAHYAGAWHHVSFREFEASRIRKSWPECDSGAALGTPIIERLDARALVAKPLPDDVSASPFVYWWHAVESIGHAIDQHAEILQQHLRTRVRQVPFGDITYEATEDRSYKCLFARHKSELKRRLLRMSTEHEVVYQTPIVRAIGGKGWAAVIVQCDALKAAHHIYEPGAHILSASDFNWLQELLSSVGAQVEVLTDTTWRANLQTEVDLSKGDRPIRPFLLFRRGEYLFTRSTDSDSDYDLLM